MMKHHGMVFDEPQGQLLGHSVYNTHERHPNLTPAGIGLVAFVLTCRLELTFPRRHWADYL